MRSFFYGLLLLIPWLALIGIGTWRIVHRTPPAGSLSSAESAAEVTAAHKIPVSWLIRKNDLRGEAAHAKSLLGLYTAVEIGEGKAVRAQDLTRTPKILVAAGKVPYRFPVDASLAADLNARSKVAIFEKGAAVIPESPVLAVECSASCVAILELSLAESAFLSSGPAGLAVMRRQ
jgi:hypothetical protein